MTEMKSSWVTAKPEEVKTKIIELAKEGMSAERIGLHIRDQHGIPKVKLLGLKISKILREAKLWQDGEQKNLEKKIENLGRHGEKHKHDYKARRSLMKYTARHNLQKKKRN